MASTASNDMALVKRFARIADEYAMLGSLDPDDRDDVEEEYKHVTRLVTERFKRLRAKIKELQHG